MGFQFKELIDSEWTELCNSIGNISVFGDPVYLDCFERAYHVKKKLIVILDKEQPCLLFSFFEKAREIVCPNQYFFQFLWEKEEKTSWRRLMVLEFMIAELKARYHSIHLRLSITMDDVRVFEWEGFKYNLKYTYIKRLDNLTYHQNLKRILVKSNSYRFATNIDWEDVWSKHDADMKSFQFSSEFISKTISCFRKLQYGQFVKTYNIYQQGKLLSSIIAVVDKAQRKAYFPLIGKIDLSHSGAAVYLYDYVFSELKNDGFLYVDLYGANMKSIARFKHKFDSELVSFFEVKYNRRTASLAKSITKLKQLVKKVVRS